MGRKKVAVLGGGPAAIAAAFELTATPELRKRFDVTVYQPGWRLGGKCATGRNFKQGARIEEHGLHVWFGFYDNAFSIMRAAYEELNRAPSERLATLEEAFKGCDEVVLYDRQGEGWQGFPLIWQRNDEIPGVDHELPDFWEIAAICCGLAVEQFRVLAAERSNSFPTIAGPHSLTPSWFSGVARALALGIGIDAAQGGEHLLYAAHRLVRARLVLRQVSHAPLVREVPGMRGPGRSVAALLLAGLLTRFRDWLWDHVVRDRCAEDPHLRLYFTIFDIFASATEGIVKDGVLERGWDAINDRELCDWLRAHSAKEVTLGRSPADRSPLLRAVYDVAFAYPRGVIDDANAAAGTAMSLFLRLLFSYRGSIAYKMQAGMAETVLTPLYEVLKDRGVHFKFFHTVTGLVPSADGGLVDQIEVVPQVALKKTTYDPLVVHEGIGCWPSEPLWTQLQKGERLEQDEVNFELDPNPLKRAPVTLERGRDFDSVVLGIPVGALPKICGRIASRHEHQRFARMLRRAETVRTQALQLWLSKPTPELGWAYSTNSITCAYVEPLDTWCDMSHLLAFESWPPGAEVRAIAYFCGVLEDREGEGRRAAEARVKRNAKTFLEGDIGGLWPRAVIGGEGSPIDWRLLADSGGRTGGARLKGQYWRANTTPSERYVLTPARAVFDRLAAHESGLANLVLAGDWTRNGIDAGCVESAMTSGLQAARALIGHHRRFPGESLTWMTDHHRASDSVRTPTPKGEST